MTETTTYALPDDRRARLDAQLAADIARTTDAAFADDLRELEARGLITSTFTPARERLTDVGAGVIRECIVSGVLTARDELRQAQVDLANAIDTRVARRLAEDAAAREYATELVGVTAELHATGLAGTNEKAREANLKVRVQRDPVLRRLADDLATKTAARIEAEGRERAADTRHKALRVELEALGHLASNR